jgi:hypothetical protein
MRSATSANDSPYWPSCAHDPGFLPWLHRFIAVVNNTRPDTPFPVLLRMVRQQGNVPPDWALAVRFMMEHARTA